ncbi:MAG: hypothetical protein KME29_20890 [Calothrix sp. FI2-JRJ7]|jgi:hypothetical protein|nr:hypothetical protein [Calothrix sp. FI2-JRJ7]
MLPEIYSLPFSIPGAYQGFATVNGIALINATELTLEFEVKDNLFGLLKSVIHKVQIPIYELCEVNLNTNWFSTKLIIQTRSMETISQIPENSAGKIKLAIARQHREIAQQFVSILKLNMAETKLNSLNSVT